MSAGSCQTCGRGLGARNRSGFCRKHYSGAKHVGAGFGAKISAGIKRRLAADPEFAEALRARAIKASASENAAKARHERWHREKVWLQGNRAATAPEVRAKAARTCSATRLAWCPPHLRDEYLRLVYSARFKAAEARRMIEEQEAAEMARWRREHGYPEPEREAA